MPSAELKFTLPSETDEFNHALKGAAYHCILFEMDQKLREKIRFGNLPQSQTECFQQISCLLGELCAERDVYF